MIDLKKHPCFNKEAKHEYGRVHLPVAPKCNVQCNYCNRKYDCVNESRPGVTSGILAPKQAVEYLKKLVRKLPNIAVAGIAGPGDPMANPEETLETMRLVRKEFPGMLLCLSTNGLNLYEYIDEIADIGISHVTITMNGINPSILGKIYSWARYNKKVYRGEEAGKILLENQIRSIQKLKEKGITVKINTIILPGYNEYHIEMVAQKVAELGADIINCIPVVPNKETVFEDITEPCKDLINLVRHKVSAYIDPMTHCARCRADAAGLLGKDYTEAPALIREYTSRPLVPGQDRPYTAVASYEGILVNQHLGEADELLIYKETRNGYRPIDKRVTPPKGTGDLRWSELAGKLSDCRAILVGGAGPNPSRILEQAGIKVVQMTGLIDTGLDSVYKGKILRTIKKADAFRCGQVCSGNAQGCA